MKSSAIKLVPLRKLVFVVCIAIVLISAVLFTLNPHALRSLVYATGSTFEIASHDYNKDQSDGLSVMAYTDDTGNLVSFASGATDIVNNDTNGLTDIFVYDRSTNSAERVSVDSSGVEANGSSYEGSISGEGRFVVFQSQASNLTLNDNNGTVQDIFVHDRDTDVTEAISINQQGRTGNGMSAISSISDDGEYVVFASQATDLVPNDTNNAFDVFLFNRNTSTMIRISVDSNGNQSNGASINPRISGSGKFVTFESNASNLVSDDTNNTTDIFRYQIETGEVIRVSVNSCATEGNLQSELPSISENGSRISFRSRASNLVLNDTNGKWDVFVHDVNTATTMRVNLTENGEQSTQNVATGQAISGDGSKIVYSTVAAHVITDTNGVEDIYSYDIGAGSVSLVSVGPNDVLLSAQSSTPDNNFNGDTVVYWSDDNTVLSSENGPYRDVFINQSQ